MARNFPTMYDRMDQIKEFISDAGLPFRITYKYVVEEGIRKLVPDGTENVQQQIDEFGEVQDIHVILQRFMNGDTSVLNQRQGQYFDATKMPGTYAEMFDLISNGKEMFESLPDDIRREFDNNPYEFFKSMDQPEFSERIKKFLPKETESEVKESAE